MCNGIPEEVILDSFLTEFAKSTQLQDIASSTYYYGEAERANKIVEQSK